MKRLVTYNCLLVLILALQACKGKQDDVQFYKEEDYQKITNVGSISLPEGVELFVNKKDTSYKLLKSYWDNGKVQVKSYIRNGLKNGMTTQYFLDGSLISEGEFTNGKKNGTFRKFHPNGKVYSVEHFSFDKPVGDWNYYDTTGSLVKTVKH